MIRLTNLADYGVVLMCQMAKAPVDIHSAFQLAQETGIPVPTVSKILGSLSKAGLLNSQRGLKGGFMMTRKPREVSMADIIEAIDGPIALTNCIEHSPGDCCFEAGCAMRPHWQAINEAVKGALSKISLDEVATSSTPFSFEEMPRDEEAAR